MGSRMIKGDDELYELIEHVRHEFLEHHPEFCGMRLSKRFLLIKACEYYLRE